MTLMCAKFSKLRIRMVRGSLVIVIKRRRSKMLRRKILIVFQRKWRKIKRRMRLVSQVLMEYFTTAQMRRHIGCLSPIATSGQLRKRSLQMSRLR